MSLRSFLISQSPVLASLALASLGLGFFLGVLPSRSEPLDPTEDDSGATDNSEINAQSIPDGDLSAIKAGMLEPCKVVLVVRTDLNMTTGKISEQCGRATLSCYKALMQRNPQLVRHWKRTGQAKIALRAKSEKQLTGLETTAKGLNLCARASFDQPTLSTENGSGKYRTVLAIGPGPVEIVNRVTGKLRLL